ncbi:hypothetical protein PCANC_24130 [Puccinia coronata f. sp. avenae]|uniref:Uncharacterized protein n=1 Tax=Puccinia coronata f. sp. avenae TaxID=200324 RepID=A0A2N5S9P7_9BASI|nr:hypothetical protein PCANC_25773 [Puccinia coronata f. sp. avenae]PLW30649.1 hypothetical protein PCANC_24130 [Puccinia coronata f. sp. avenae]
MGRLLRRFKASLSSDCPYHQANPAVVRSTSTHSHHRLGNPLRRSEASCAGCPSCPPGPSSAGLPERIIKPSDTAFLQFAYTIARFIETQLISYSHLPPDQLVFNQPSSSSRFEHKPPSNTFFTVELYSLRSG